MQIYTLIALITLAALAYFYFKLPKSKRKKASGLTTTAFILILFGLFFSQSRLIGYSLITAGVILAVVDILGIKK